MQDENLQKLFDLSYIQMYSTWTEIRNSMLWAHQEIVRLQNKIAQLEKSNANS